MKGYRSNDEFPNGSILSEEMTDGYDLTGSLEVLDVAVSANLESDYFLLPDGKIAVVDLCGIVQWIDDSLTEAAEWNDDEPKILLNDEERRTIRKALYDARYDMDCIADGGRELRQAVEGLTDTELINAYSKQMAN